MLVAKCPVGQRIWHDRIRPSPADDCDIAGDSRGLRGNRDGAGHPARPASRPNPDAGSVASVEVVALPNALSGTGPGEPPIEVHRTPGVPVRQSRWTIPARVCPPRRI